jgi:hypothetical protein
VFIEPADGSTTTEGVIAVRGLAAPRSVITRDIPLWFDEHVTADSAGRWSFVLQLNEGQNTFKFRIGDDLATERTLTVYYAGS